MKNYIIILFLAAMILSPDLTGQQRAANISFTETVWNYGEIKEEDGVANHKFEFTNTGSEPLIIHNVSASCGCTAPSWTREPVMPGGKGFVNAAYDPKGRPGHFDKYVTVHSNANTGAINLRITGIVISKPLSVEDEFRYAMGNLRFKTNHISFGTVHTGQSQARVEEMVNNSDQPINIEIRDIPAHIKVKPLQIRLNPRQKGTVEISYNASGNNDWGFMIDRLNVLVNGQTDRTHQLIISANIEENFSGMTEQERANAPSIAFEETTFNFGKMKQGSKVDYEYEFTNTGKSDLIIRKVSAPCGCTATMLSDNLIPAGKSGKIQTSFNSAGRRGSQSQTITVITNDPNNPRVTLWIRGEVED